MTPQNVYRKFERRLRLLIDLRQLAYFLAVALLIIQPFLCLDAKPPSSHSAPWVPQFTSRRI